MTTKIKARTIKKTEGQDIFKLMQRIRQRNARQNKLYRIANQQTVLKDLKEKQLEKNQIAIDALQKVISYCYNINNGLFQERYGFKDRRKLCDYINSLCREIKEKDKNEKCTYR